MPEIIPERGSGSADSKTFHSGFPAAYDICIKIPKLFLAACMAVCGKMKHHGTESSGYMYGAEQEITGWKGKWKGGGKVQDNRGPGTAEIIMVLAVLVILTIVFRKQLAGLAAWFYGSLYR